MSAALIPSIYVPKARTDADWAFDIQFEGEDWSQDTVRVVLARRGLPAQAFEATVGNGLLAPTADLGVGLRIAKATWSNKTPGDWTVEVLRLTDEDGIDDAAMFSLSLQRGLSDLLTTPGIAPAPVGDGNAVGGVIVRYLRTAVVVRGGGVTGPAGLSLLHGSEAPAADQGRDGEFYLDTTENRLYGPKSGASWGAGVLLVGPPGARGTMILNGPNPPTNADGTDGDFWINPIAAILYGPKAAGVWPAGVSLKAPVESPAVLANYGDSHAGLGFLDNGLGAYRAAGQGAVNWLSVLAGKSIAQLQYGSGGDTTTKALQRLSTVIASPATIVVLQVGTNDICLSAQADSVTNAQVVKDNIATMITALLAGGKKVWLFTIPPRSGTQIYRLSKGMVRRLLSVNDWIRTTYAKATGVTIIDTWASVAEPGITAASITGSDDEIWSRPGFSVRGGTLGVAGTGYGPNTYVLITHNGGTGAAIEPIIVGGIVKGLKPTGYGYGYSNVTPPTATIVDPDGGGSGATITSLTLTGGVVDWTLTAGGTGYVEPLRVTIPDMPGIIAALTYTLTSGAISAVVVANGNVDNGRGALWDSIAVGGKVALTITGGGGAGAVINALIGPAGTITGFEILNGGAGYTAGAVLSATQSGAASHSTDLTLTAGVVTAARVRQPGFGYTSPPAATITTGAGATLTPVMGTTFMWRPNALAGDTHEGPEGALIEAGLLLPHLPASVKMADPIPLNLIDGTFGGSAGTLGTGATGVVADGWSFGRTAGTATGAVAYKAADSQVMTLAPTKTGGNNVMYTLERILLLSDLGLAVGDTISAEVTIDMRALYGCNQVGILLCDAQGATISQQAEFMSRTTQGYWKNKAVKGPFRPLVPLVVGARNAAVDRLYLRILANLDCANSPAGGGFNLAVSDLRLGKIA